LSRHADTMMSTLERLKDRFDGAQEEVAPTDRVPFIFPTYLAMFVFLKFITSAMPMIQCDVADDVDM